MARRRLQLAPDRSARRGRSHDATAAAATRTVRVLEPIIGLDFGAVTGDIIDLPEPTAARYVELGIAEYAVPPIQEAVQRLHDLGCGVALPASPPDEVQAAVGAVGARTTDL